MRNAHRVLRLFFLIHLRGIKAIKWKNWVLLSKLFFNYFAECNLQLRTCSLILEEFKLQVIKLVIDNTYTEVLLLLLLVNLWSLFEDVLDLLCKLFPYLLVTDLLCRLCFNVILYILVVLFYFGGHHFKHLFLNFRVLQTFFNSCSDIILELFVVLLVLIKDRNFLWDLFVL